MSDNAFEVSAHFKTTASTAGVDQIDAAQKAAEASAKDLAGELTSTGAAATETEDKLTQMANEAKAGLESVKQRLATMKSDLQAAGTEGGEAFSEGMNAGTKKAGGLSNVGNMIDVQSAIMGAWESGTQIGTALWGAIERTMQDGLSWESILGPSEAAQAAEKAGAAWREAMGEILQSHKELIDTLNNDAPDNATKWLSDMDAAAKRALESMKALQLITQAGDKARAAEIQNTYEDRVAEIDGSGASDGEKTRMKSEAAAQREKGMLEERRRARQKENADAEREALAALQREGQAEAAVREQQARAAAAAAADVEAKKAAATNAGSPEFVQKEAAERARRESLTKSGYDASSFGSAQEEAAALQRAQEAAKRAAEESSAAAKRRMGIESANAIEDSSDIDSTGRSVQRMLGAAGRQANAQDASAQSKADAEAAKQAAAADKLGAAADKLGNNADAGDLAKATAGIERVAAGVGQVAAMKTQVTDLVKRIANLESQFQNR